MNLKLKHLLLSAAVIIMTSLYSEAKIVVEKKEYKSGNQSFEGLVAYDTEIKKPVPGIVVFHNWKGVSAETESKITELAKLGYVAFAADVYGKGIRPQDAKSAGAEAGKYKNNRQLLRERTQLGLTILKGFKNVDAKKTFATGYCFGGTAALELARSGADVLGVVSFHGGLANPTPADAKNIKGQVQIYHGAIDPGVPAEEVAAFQKEMDEAKVTYQITSYSGAVHSFTDKAAGNDISKGQAYNELADQRSWKGMKEFLSELSK